jgi:hypothetical protein
MAAKEKARWQAGRNNTCAQDSSAAAAASRTSLRNAINGKCRECSHDPAAPGTWREQVAQCAVIRCALWPVRPAPSGGPFATPPRDPATVTPAWLGKPHGWAFAGHPSHMASPPEGAAGGAA